LCSHFGYILLDSVSNRGSGSTGWKGRYPNIVSRGWERHVDHWESQWGTCGAGDGGVGGNVKGLWCVLLNVV
jgi:hypothetical protein